MGDRQWPDPRGWEALTQAEAERDARDKVNWSVSGRFLREREEALAQAKRERDQAREALRRIDAEGHRYKPWWAGGTEPEEHADTCQGCIARAALAEEPQT